MGLCSSLRAYVIGAATGIAIGAAVATNYHETANAVFSVVSRNLADKYSSVKKAVGYENNEQLEKTEEPDKMLELEKRIDALEKREVNESK